MIRSLALSVLAVVAPAFAAGRPLRAVDAGIAVDFKVEGPLREGDPARFHVKLATESSGTPLAGVYPGAWLASSTSAEPLDRASCTARVAAFAGGNMFTRPALSLNQYYVIALNGDGSLTVVDPQFGFGGTKLLGMLQLEGPGFDWSLIANDDRLLVTIPAANQVAVIDTTRWKLLKNLDAGPEPRRVVVQADGHYAWIATADGVTVLRTADLSIAARIATGKGPHDIAVTPDNRTAIVTNRGSGMATLIDVATLKMVAQGPAGKAPVAVAWSPLSQLAYVASEDGVITGIDPKKRRAVVQITTEAGLERIRFAPGGRYAFTLNPSRDLMHILDVSSNRIIQTGELEGGPFEVTFTATLAYIRRRESELVLMVPLANIGEAGRQIAVVEFPGGDVKFGRTPRTTIADGIVAAPGDGAVLVANPGDEGVHFYKEGMAAPSGHFTNYGHDPQAVLVLDRSLRETSPGTFIANATLPPAGTYDVALFVDAPRVITCFRVVVAENPELQARLPRTPLMIEHLTAQIEIAAGAPASLEVRLRDAKTREPARTLADAGVLIVQASGSWSQRQPLVAEGDGRYATRFTPPVKGVYYIYVECPSVGLRASNPHFLVLRAE
ncbi:MAG TPA: cytochrome D1 domain-containing protein [Thermoanaerobaculia bacterium]|nr:cytochrome D1 domain-containing protein [Thermoanaerobaculia bacterium]